MKTTPQGAAQIISFKLTLYASTRAKSAPMDGEILTLVESHSSQTRWTLSEPVQASHSSMNGVLFLLNDQQGEHFHVNQKVNSLLFPCTALSKYR